MFHLSAHPEDTHSSARVAAVAAARSRSTDDMASRPAHDVEHDRICSHCCVGPKSRSECGRGRGLCSEAAARAGNSDAFVALRDLDC